MQALVIVAIAVALGVLVIFSQKHRATRKRTGGGSTSNDRKKRDKDGMASE